MGKNILVCFDEVQSGPAVLEAGRRHAKLLGCGMVVIHVQPSLSGISGYYERLFHEELDHIENLFGGPGRDELLFVRRYFDRKGELPNFKLIEGDPLEGILREAQSGGYQLVVIGTKDRKAPGKVGLEIIKKSPIDVMVVKG
jgi:nucleotide-binding universal stress UspA family protein